MTSRFVYLFRIVIFWLIFFTAARLLFLLYHFDKSFTIPVSAWFGLLIRGLWMDISITGYILMISSLIVAVLFFSERATKAVIGIMSALLLFVFTTIVLADLELYRHWSFRIDATPLFYLSSPKEAMASTKTWQIMVFGVAVILVFSAFYFFFRKLVQSLKLTRAYWWSIPVLLLVSASTILPVRGGLGIAAMNPGKVFFSQHVFANHAALNVVWNFGYSVMKSGDLKKKYPDYVEAESAHHIFNELTATSDDAPLVLKTKRPNIVIILLEGFTSKVIEPLGGVAGVTPNFTKLSDEGLLFKNFYASGDRSNKGLVAVLSGFPAQSTAPVIKSTLAVSKLPSISNTLKEENYSRTFYYGGDPDFSNIRAYINQSGFHEVVSQGDFPGSYRNSKWGVHDEFVFERLLADLDTAGQPFLKFLFTLSSHEPFDIPVTPAFPGNSEEERFLSSIHYSDECLGRFFAKAKTKEYYHNTLFILLADHGHRFPRENPYYMPERFAIPMLWIGGALEKTGVVEQIGGQTDLAKTLLYQLDLDTGRYRFSRNLLASSNSPFAYYAFNDGFGFVTPGDVFIWDHISKQPITIPADSLTEQKAFAYFHVYQNFFLGL